MYTRALHLRAGGLYIELLVIRLLEVESMPAALDMSPLGIDIVEVTIAHLTLERGVWELGIVRYGLDQVLACTRGGGEESVYDSGRGLQII